MPASIGAAHHACHSGARAFARTRNPEVVRVCNVTAPWQICGIFSAKSWRRVFHATARRHTFAVKKPSLAARKIARIPVAFGSPQDFHIALMFGAARFGEPALSGSGSVGFRIAPRRRRSPRRAGIRHKCLNQHWIFDADQTSRRAMRAKRLQRRGFSQASRASGRRFAFGLPQGA
jgi:hypothetical protein